ncbi:hypothetical protein GCM10010178_89550 [Lentzea flava]|uniref:anthranilate synthase n=2 Tax=Lentzea flava TaxID=103732 RepID=A0ABQ2VGR5_9PSEU|nr:chorismate binding enzyme [Lentzea flava]GGU85482.1 hypothetical protein GCM10010178_89550 [Lentzea flava]
MHVTLRRQVISMNPISGTFRYGADGQSEADLLRFLNDVKEIDELHMVVDEELKLMARICQLGAHVTGPRLREMSRLAHTEYLLRGKSTVDARAVLRETMYAPTVTGSPLASACRVIKANEPDGRGYYAGVLALLGKERSGQAWIDSSIIIRTAEVDESGKVRMTAGSTRVRHSSPVQEAHETATKLAGLRSAFTGQVATTAAGSRSPAPQRLATLPTIQRALRRRTRYLARFWWQDPARRPRNQGEELGVRALVVTAEDDFTSM